MQRIKVGVDTGVDRKRLKAIPNLELIRVSGVEQSIRGTRKVSKPFTIGVSTIGGTDFIAPEESDKLAALLPGAPNKAWKDRAHLLGAYNAGCQYFVTTDRTDLINNERRGRLEQLLGLKIRTIDELEKELAAR